MAWDFRLAVTKGGNMLLTNVTDTLWNTKKCCSNVPDSRKLKRYGNQMPCVTTHSPVHEGNVSRGHLGSTNKIGITDA